MTARPDFFIVGAAKCGTTALFDYLSQHPAVFMPAMKEPKHFCTDIEAAGSVRDFDAYMALFDPALPGQITGEASCWYLYSKIAIAGIMAHNPGARIIVTLRHPVDAVHSLYRARLGYNHENIADFEQAWRIQADRLAGRHMPPQWPEPKTLQYGAIYRYAAQIHRLFALVPENQRHVVIYEEFFADPRRHYDAILGFLGLPPQLDVAFTMVNPAVGARSEGLANLLRKPPGWLKRPYRLVKPLVRAAGLHPTRLLWKLNTAPQRKPPLRPAFRAELDRYFADDIAELEGLLGRRLWHKAA